MFAASAGSPSWSVDADFQFHRSIADAANNRYYVDLLVSLGTTMIATPPTRLAADEAKHLARVTSEHADMLAAIEQGDAQGAAAATRTHLANSRARLTSGQ